LARARAAFKMRAVHAALPVPIALALLVGSCRTESITTPVPPDAVIVHAQPTGTWRVVEDGELLGYVVRFEDPADALRSFFSIRNALHQELGVVDRHGRCFRYEPHVRGARWVSTGTVLEGARGILGAGERAELVAHEGPDAPAAAQPQQQ
jgi:hypothetical protein